MSISVSARPTGEGTVLVVSGELDADSGEAFQESLLRAARSYRPPLLLDLSGIGFADSAGLKALVTIRRLIEARDCGLQVIGASRAIRTAVRLTGTRHVLDKATGSSRAAADGRARRTRLR